MPQRRALSCELLLEVRAEDARVGDARARREVDGVQRAQTLEVHGHGVGVAGDGAHDAAARAEGDELHPVLRGVLREGREVLVAVGPHDGARARRTIETAPRRQELPGPEVVGVGAAIGAVGGHRVVPEARPEIVDEGIAHGPAVVPQPAPRAYSRRNFTRPGRR